MAATFDRPSVTAELAKAMIGAAEQKAAELGQPFAIAIVDDSGVLKAFSRMDGAPLLSVQVAQDKEYTRPASAWPPTRGTTSSGTTRRSPWAPLRGSTG
jgi:uncharacterized protein GlcG (DUF336 family)